jgi:hypothetical protein
VTPRLYRLIAVCLALVGQVVGAFGLPAARGSHQSPDAVCGCCPADREAGICCCHHAPAPPPEDDLPPCCRAKKARAAAVVWVVPNLRSKCQEPADTVPGSIVPASIPPELPAHWSITADDAGVVLPISSHLTSRTLPPDDPPPRLS